MAPHWCSKLHPGCLLLERGHESVHRERLGALNRKTKDTVEHELRQSTQSTRDTEDHSVELELVKTVGVEHTARSGVDVRVRVLGLTVLLKDTRRNLRETLDKLHNRRLLELRARVSEVRQSSEAWVGLAQNSVAVTRDNTAALQGRPQVVNNLLVTWVRADSLLELKGPVEHLLVGKTVQGTSQTVEGSSVRQVRVREGATDKVGSVGRHVTTLVVAVDSNVETEVVNKTLALAVAHHVRHVLDQIHVRVDGLLAVTLTEHVVVDTGSNGRELGNEVKRILESGVPVLSLLDTGVVGSSELAIVVEG